MPLFADYDYYWYQDDDGNWRNEYDDYGYEFDPDRYEGDEADTANDTTKAKSSDEASTGTVIPSSKHDDLDKQMVPPPNDHLSTPSPGNEFFLYFFLTKYPQCENIKIFLSFRFYVKSTLENLEVLKMSFLPFKEL